MPQRAWNDKRERQYEHIKEGLRERGRSEDRAEEIAARTVNKERARAGEAKESSPSSVRPMKYTSRPSCAASQATSASCSSCDRTA